jgi:hypothetical protein
MVPSFIRLRHRGLAGLALLFAATLVHAQSAAPRAEPPDPLDPRARVPAAAYPSALASYRRLGEDRPVPWKEANATVNRVGGWRAYAREAQQTEAAASAPGRHIVPPPASGAAPGQGGHKRH